LFHVNLEALMVLRFIVQSTRGRAENPTMAR
jgi:hypothetical protein